MISYEEIYSEVERLFEQNKPKDAEQLLINVLLDAEKEHNTGLSLQIQNELIGYYRQTSEQDKLRVSINEAIALAKKLELDRSQDGIIPYATTLLNAANGYRSLGELDKALSFYEEVDSLYSERLDPDDMLFAGFLNNYSLLYQELGKLTEALECQKRALQICLHNEAQFEIAVSYANLANTYVQLVDYNQARIHANEAISIFEKRDICDAHLGAAISALAMCSFYEKEYNEADKLFQKAMTIVETSIGKNSQYYRLYENHLMCQKLVHTQETGEDMRGIELSRKYYLDVVKPGIHDLFPEYESAIAVGLVGEGSECFGYDDEASRDHDWGPELCLWVSDITYDEIGDKLIQFYEKLPTEYMGFTRNRTRQGANRRGIWKISEFYKYFLGSDSFDGINWISVPDYSFAAACNGEVFADEAGSFTEFRKQLLQGYPESVRYARLAEDLALLSQSGQYNYARMLKRGDRVTADIELAKCIRSIMIIAHHLENKYPPHDKWLYRSMLALHEATTNEATTNEATTNEFPASVTEVLLQFIHELHGSFALDDEQALGTVTDTCERLGYFLAEQMYAADIISDIDPYLDFHTDELLKKSEYSKLTNDELVDRIARTEFTAFDKVKNEGGRASCQNDWPTFSVMRKSQYLSWTRPMLLQYLYDFVREYDLGHNLITEKYGRMMESTAPEQYEEIKDEFPALSEQKKAIIETIVSIQMEMLDEFGAKYPNSAKNTRSFRTVDDNYNNTSYETYLRGEISTYSDKMLQLYAGYVIECAQSAKNIAIMTIDNTARLYGFKNIDEFEACKY